MIEIVGGVVLVVVFGAVYLWLMFSEMAPWVFLASLGLSSMEPLGGGLRDAAYVVVFWAAVYGLAGLVMLAVWLLERKNWSDKVIGR